MTKKEDDPEHWRARAAEARKVAGELHSLVFVRRALEIADIYDDMAASAEQRKNESRIAAHSRFDSR